MARFALKSAFPLAVLLGLACAVPAATIAQAQETRDPANARNLNDPATQRNLNGSFQAQGRPLNDPADQRNLNGKFQAQGRPLNDPAGARGNKTSTNGLGPNQKADKKDVK